MRVLIAEDSDRVHEGLVALLRACPGVRLAGRATSEDAAVALVAREKPDVLLLDLHLAPGSGLEVLRRLRRDGSAVRVLVVTGDRGAALRARCIAEGADGFFDKDAGLDDLVAHLRALAAPSPAGGAGMRTPAPAQGAVDAELDALAGRAAAATGCPMAAVSLAGVNRQWMVGREGVDLRCVSRHVAFCTHVDGALLEIRDTRTDARLARNPLVDAPFGIRFYAGAPIVLADGAQVGVVCVMAREPGALEAAQRDALTALAAEAAARIQRLQAAALVDRARLAHDGPPAHLAAGTDPLTGLPRRDAVAQGLPAAGEGMLCLDIDRFCRINHALGREAADALLVEVARRIAARLPDGVVARLSGDDFAVRVPGPVDDAALRALGECLAGEISRPLQAAGRVLRLRASIGMALAADAADRAELLCRADLAMRHAKQLGGNACQLYAPWMGRRANDRVDMEEDLRAALARREFELEYQPLMDLASGRLAGAEALVRWRHPVRGTVAPDAFVGLAEETGLIRELGEQVLDLALAQLARWDATGPVVPRLAVNVSALQLEPGLARTVADALARNGLGPDRLEIEVTESALPRDDAAAEALLQALRELGVSLAVDDFGTGYSSLAALRRMPVGTLKIDRRFTAGLGHAPEDAAVVGAIVSMAHALGMRATAEGVEDAIQERCLVALGCDVVQGFRYGHPMDAGAFARRFARARPAPLHASERASMHAPAGAARDA